MRYAVKDLVKEVRVAIDHNNGSGTLLDDEDIDTLTLDEIIRSKIEDAARIVESNAPHHLLDNGVALTNVATPATGNEDLIVAQSSYASPNRPVEGLPEIEIDGPITPIVPEITWENRNAYVGGQINLPDNFMRLVTFKMSDWERPVISAISEEAQQYAMQKSRYAGVRGNPQRPVVAIVAGVSGKVLEFYSCKNKLAYVEQARYLPYPTIGTDEKINLCEKLKRAVVYYTAHLVANTIGDDELAGKLSVTATELMK